MARHRFGVRKSDETDGVLLHFIADGEEGGPVQILTPVAVLFPKKDGRWEAHNLYTSGPVGAAIDGKVFHGPSEMEAATAFAVAYDALSAEDEKAREAEGRARVEKCRRERLANIGEHGVRYHPVTEKEVALLAVRAALKKAGLSVAEAYRDGSVFQSSYRKSYRSGRVEATFSIRAENPYETRQSYGKGFVKDPDTATTEDLEAARVKALADFDAMLEKVHAAMQGKGYVYEVRRDYAYSLDGDTLVKAPLPVAHVVVLGFEPNDKAEVAARVRYVEKVWPAKQAGMDEKKRQELIFRRDEDAWVAEQAKAPALEECPFCPHWRRPKGFIGERSAAERKGWPGGAYGCLTRPESRRGGTGASRNTSCGWHGTLAEAKAKAAENAAAAKEKEAEQS